MKKANHRPGIGILAMLLVYGFMGCKPPQSNSLYLGIESGSVDSALHSLLDTWYPRIIDTIHGGYWTNFEYDWSLSQNQDKMLVTQARGLWTASRAAAVFPDNRTYRKAADHGYQFLTGCMWDVENGGFYQYYYADSVQTVDPLFKLTYGNAFAIFALAEYARINNDPAVLEWVKKAFYWLESAAHDPEGKGYFNIILPENLAEFGLNASDAIKKASWGNADWKDQNTSIHLMEAFTAAYQVMPEESIRIRLAEMLELVRDTMMNQEGYLHLFFSSDWVPVSSRDSSREAILTNPYYDHISFGHNIETAYLLLDASQTLFGAPDPATLAAAKKMIDHTLQFGFDKDFYGLFDKGYKFPPGRDIEIIDSTKVWWAQAEAWHALALFAGIYPEETNYQQAFAKMWTYIQREMIDHQYGGWYNNGLDKNPDNKSFRKAHQWKSCYHDGRALLQVHTYASKGKEKE